MRKILIKEGYSRPTEATVRDCLKKRLTSLNNLKTRLKEVGVLEELENDSFSINYKLIRQACK